MKPINYDHYLAYIKSDAWKDKKTQYWKSQRLELLQKDPNWRLKCRCCMKKFDNVWDFDIHHLTYRNFGNEKITELVHICRECHDNIHLKARSLGINMFVNGNKNGNLWDISKMEIASAKRDRKKAKRIKANFKKRKS